MTTLIDKFKQHLFGLIPTKIYLKLLYKKILGKKLNLKNPRTLNEKIQWKKIYDRNPIYTKCADKYAVREYIKEKIGEKYLIPLLYVTNKPEEIPFDKLPLPYIIKPNHGSGWFIIIKKREDINKKEIIKKCKGWLNSSIYLIAREWHCKDIPPKIVIEKLLTKDDEKVPDDCRFYCFNGKVEFIQMDVNRFENHERGIFDLNWKPLPFTWCSIIDGELKYKTKEDILKPKNLNEMIKVAEKLSKDFNFVRVDLYSLNGEIYFGELTFTPACGLSPFVPDKYDLIYGKKLKLRKYKKKSS